VRGIRHRTAEIRPDGSAAATRKHPGSRATVGSETLGPQPSPTCAPFADESIAIGVGFNYTHSEASLTDPAVIAAANSVLKPIVDRGYSRYDTVTGNHTPYLQPTDGLPKLVMPSAPGGIALRAKTAEPAAAPDNSTDQRPTSGSQTRRGRGGPGR
jgi:hypothetical protein